MKYTKIEWQGIIRTLLSAFGAFLVGKNLFGHAVDQSYLQEVIGLVMGVISVIWSIVDKSATVEMVQGGLRQAITFIGGLLVGAGTITGQTLDSVLGIITAIGPFIQGYLARVKNNQLDSGKITITHLKK